MISGGMGLLLGGLASLALRRWPAMGIAVGISVSWLIDGWDTGWTPRAGGVVAALVGLVVARWLPRWAWWGVGPLAAVLTFGPLGWELDQKVVWGTVIAIAMVGTAEGLRRAPPDGSWGVVGVALVTGTVLTALTGSVRVAEETARLVLPVVCIIGRPAHPRALAFVGTVSAAAWMQGVVWSSLGVWVLVPFVCLGAAWMPRSEKRPVWLPTAVAVLVGAVGAAPVVVDWIRAPPF